MPPAAPVFRRADLKNFRPTRDVLSLMIGVDPVQRLVVLKVRFRDAHTESFTLVASVARHILACLEDTCGRAPDPRRRTADPDPIYGLERRFLDDQPNILDADWRGEADNGNPAVHGCGVHYFAPHLYFSLLIQPDNNIYAVLHLHPAAFFYLRDYLREVAADGMLDTGEP